MQTYDMSMKILLKTVRVKTDYKEKYTIKFDKMDLCLYPEYYAKILNLKM